MCDKTIVLDNGTGSIKAGFAEDEDPTAVFPNLTGTLKSEDIRRVNFRDFSNSERYQQFVNGVKYGDLKVAYPMERGVIVDWEGMEAVWSYTFSEALKANPEECNLLITEAVMNPKPNREKMAQVLFEKYNFPAIFISQSAILPLYSSGLTTGVVLECGEGTVQTVPVWGGYPIAEAMNRVDFGGRDISHLLGRLLQEKGYGTKPLEVLRLIKEKVAFVKQTGEKSDTELQGFQLPDGEIIKLGEERHLCSEMLFDPSLMDDSDKGGVHEMLYKSIMKTNMDIRKDLYGNIVLCGGSTLFPGFVERMSQEIAGLLPPKAKLTIRATPDRHYATWKGASVLASLSNFGSKLLISKQEYEEVGPSIMHKNK